MKKNMLLIFLILIIIYGYMTIKFYKYGKKDDNKKSNDQISRNLIETNLNLVEISIKLNNAMQIIGKLKCEAAKSSKEVSPNGGWCAAASSRNSQQHKTDLDFAKTMSEFLKNKTVASFGDGPGVYKEIIDGLNQVKLYDAFDGSPYAEINSHGQVKFLDLSIPIHHLDKYDWVISIEVAEHIPKEFENIYLNNLVKHAKEGIIISWASEGQGGFSHVNERNFEYVKTKMKSLGLKHDYNSSIHFKKNANLIWLKNNLNVFYK
jgi:hypothetical protein